MIIEKREFPIDLEAIALLCGVTYATVRMWRTRKVLPEPDGFLGQAPGWWRSHILAWAIETKRNAFELKAQPHPRTPGSKPPEPLARPKADIPPLEPEKGPAWAPKGADGPRGMDGPHAHRFELAADGEIRCHYCAAQPVRR